MMTGKQEVSVESLMQRMRTLSQKHDECSETELNYRFKIVEQQVIKRLTTTTTKTKNLVVLILITSYILLHIL